MTPSSRQEVVYQEWQTTDNNILIQAVAGSGKTTTLMGLVEKSPYRTLMLAFNKSIQVEFEKRINDAGYKHAKALTLHSLGLKAIQYVYKNDFVVEKGKNYHLIKRLMDYNKKDFATMKWEEKAKTTMTIMELNDVSRIYLTNDLKVLFGYMNQMDKYYYEHPKLQTLWDEFLFIRDASYRDKPIIDFLDMIYLPIRNNMLIPIQPYFLMIDEAQDLNLAQHTFIEKLISQGDVHKWVAVGDVHQAIYGFSGAHTSSFDLFRQKPNVVELPLDVCYRCPRSIIEQANAVYPVMQAFKQEEGIVEEEEWIENIQPGAMVVCRNTTPLIELYFALLGIGMPAYLMGEDILSGIVRYLKPYSYKTIREAGSKLASEVNLLINKENKTDEERIKMYKLQQNYDNFVLLSQNLCKPSDTVEILLQTLERLFDNPGDGAVTLCTIHKSKGLEADVVYILNEHLIPSKFARSKEQLEQEKNLKYVARTRARKELYYLNLDKNKNS